MRPYRTTWGDDVERKQDDVSLRHLRSALCDFTYLYGGIRPIPSFLEYPRGKSQISTWIFFIPHVEANHFFRSFISFLRSFISFLGGIFYSPRGDFEISTWKSLFPDRVPFRYVVGSKLLRLLQKSTVSQSCLQDCPDFAERMKRKALRGRSEAHIPPYVTEAESRKQHSDSPLCNSLLL